MFKQGINIKTICANYILEFRNTQSHLFQIHQWVKIEIVFENHACKIVGHFYFLIQALSKYILVNAIVFFSFVETSKNWKIFTSKLESHPLKTIMSMSPAHYYITLKFCRHRSMIITMEGDISQPITARGGVGGMSW